VCHALTRPALPLHWTSTTATFFSSADGPADSSAHFGAFDANIFTEYHSRYGVLIYWHVERKSMVIHSQVINCSASEAAAMMNRPIRWDLIADQYDQMIKYAPRSGPGRRRPRRSCAASSRPT
jgi:TnpA family transposase